MHWTTIVGFCLLTFAHPLISYPAFSQSSKRQTCSCNTYNNYLKPFTVTVTDSAGVVARYEPCTAAPTSGTWSYGDSIAVESAADCECVSYAGNSTSTWLSTSKGWSSSGATDFANKAPC